jgi:uncharacterized membrane protein YkvA (DUF1232 family)
MAMTSDSFHADEKFWKKISKNAIAAGEKVIILALELYYAYLSPTTPNKSKRIIAGALIYFLFPIDIIPDPIPFLGFSDDFIVLAMAMLSVYEYVDDEIRRKAREKFNFYFK